MFEHFRAELRRSWTVYLRYPMDFFSGLAIMFVTFYVLLAGAKYVAGPATQFGDRLDGIILGYWLWNLAVFAFSYTATAVRLEAMAGTLEQLYLSPFSSLRIFIVRCLASLTMNLLTSSLLLGLLLLITGRRLSFSPMLVFPLVAVLLATYGFGLAMSGISLLFKQTGQFQAIAQFALLPLVMVPFESWGLPWLRHVYAVLPVVPAAEILRDLMTRASEPGLGEYAVALANGAAYLVVGIILFRMADRQARLRGLLSQH